MINILRFILAIILNPRRTKKEEMMHPSESALRKIIIQIENAWRFKQFDGLEICFHEDAVIVGPGYVELGRGRQQCAASYRDFAENASILSYTEASHTLQTWETTAIYTYHWDMTYERDAGVKRESGSDQLVFQLLQGRWQMVWRFMFFTPDE
jgi:hypothetical protein